MRLDPNCRGRANTCRRRPCTSHRHRHRRESREQAPRTEISFRWVAAHSGVQGPELLNQRRRREGRPRPRTATAAPGASLAGTPPGRTGELHLHRSGAPSPAAPTKRLGRRPRGPREGGWREWGRVVSAAPGPACRRGPRGRPTAAQAGQTVGHEAGPWLLPHVPGQRGLLSDRASGTTATRGQPLVFGSRLDLTDRRQAPRRARQLQAVLACDGAGDTDAA